MADRDSITPSMASAAWRTRCEKPSPADYIWLSYSLFFFIEPVIRNNRGYWLRSALVYLPFVAVYILFVHARRLRPQLWLLAAMATLGLIGFSFNGGASSLLTLATAFLPFVVEDVVTILVCFACTAAAITAVGMAVHESWLNLGIAYFLIAVVGSSNIFVSQRKRANARLSLAQDEIERLAALAERERIARDMHDVLGHTLSVIVLKSELAGRLLSRDGGRHHAAALAEIADVESTARKALAEVREAIGGYRARGLPAEIDNARRILGTAGVTLTADLPPQLRLSPTEETVLSLAVREAVTNIIRHARATTAVIRLSSTPAGDQTLLIEDNGANLRTAPPHEGNGLRGMRERVEALGGNLALTPAAPGALAAPGTRLRIHLPNSFANSVILSEGAAGVEGPAVSMAQPGHDLAPAATVPTTAAVVLTLSQPKWKDPRIPLAAATNFAGAAEPSVAPEPLRQ